MIRISAALVLTASALAAFPTFAADLTIAEPIDAPTIDAPSRAYATVFAGASLPSADITASGPGVPVGISFEAGFDTGYIFGVAVGAEVLPSLRGEVEFSVIKADISGFEGFPVPDGFLSSTGYNLLGNLWYDVETDSGFTPYIGGGIGYGYDVITSDLGGGEINTSGFLYQLGAGVRFAATEQISLDLGYRYRVQPNAEITQDGDGPEDGELESSADNHILQAGVSFNF